MRRVIVTLFFVAATAQESKKNARTHITLDHDAQHPSFLALPLSE